MKLILAPYLLIALLAHPTVTLSQAKRSHPDGSDTRITVSSPTSIQASPSSLLFLFDVFPLSHNMHYSYSYMYSTQSFFTGFTEQYSIDTGSVQYIVRDPVAVTDSSIIWAVTETSSLWHERFVGSTRKDTTYVTVDTVTFSLTESTVGRHELSSRALLWAFPITSPTRSIYRYADITTFSFARTWQPSYLPGDGRDSLSFSQASGFNFREANFEGGGIEQYIVHLHVRLRGTPTFVRNDGQPTPQTVALRQNYPNPFNPTTNIEYDLPRSSNISLVLFDVLGRQIRILDEGVRQPGLHIISVNLRDLPSGVYFYRLSLQGYIQTNRMMLAK